MPLDERERTSFARAVYQLAKGILYLNPSEAVQANRPERSELLKRLRRLGPKKAVRLQRKLARAYDRIVIGGRREVEGLAGVSADSGPRHRASALEVRARPADAVRRDAGGDSSLLGPAGPHGQTWPMRSGQWQRKTRRYGGPCIP